MSTESKHTPTPWKFDDDTGCRSIKGGKAGTHKQGQYQEVACTVGLHNDEVDHANAALIVRAVNCHDDLVKALDWALDKAERYIDDNENAITPLARENLATMRAILARAKAAP